MSAVNIATYRVFKAAIKPLKGLKLSTRYPLSRIYNFCLPYITPTVVKEIEVNGYRMRAKTGGHNTDGVGQLLAFEGEYERTQTDLVKRIVKPGMNCIDVGANIGYYTLLLSNLIKDGHVWAIEPESSNLLELRYNIALNNFNNIEVLEIAAGNENKLVDFYISGISPGRHSTVMSRKDGGYKTTIHMTTLDHLIDKPIDFIKSDAEGNDLNVMIGAKELIKRSPNLKWVMEIWAVGLSKLGQTVKDVFDTAHEYGFKRYTMIDDNNDKLILLNGNTLETVNKYLKYRNSVNVLFEK